MRLSELFDSKELSENMSDVVIGGLAFDSRKVKPGDLYFALVGSSSDGHDFLEMAISSGAGALVVQDRKNVRGDLGIPVIEVSNSRLLLAKASNLFFGRPTENLFCVGITGTNGKTTVSYIVEFLLNKAGYNCGVMGTIDHHLGNEKWESSLTTPDPVSLFSRFKDFQKKGARAVAMEISSHALKQSRADFVSLDVGVFTNLSRDHLDYHSNMEEYFDAKEMLFTRVLRKSSKAKKFAIVNTEDPHGRELQIPNDVQVIRVGRGEVEISIEYVKSDFLGLSGQFKYLNHLFDFQFPMIGTFNVTNLAQALGVGVAKGLDFQGMLDGLAQFAGVPGRLQAIPGRGKFGFVDYAHTPDALKNVLESLNQIRIESKSCSRLITVFGCGGDRDQGKRPLMFEVANRLSDFVIVTSDNPRSEDPEKIIGEIVGENQSAVCETDRRKAIELAVSEAKEGDVILIAGKGHEDYQILRDKTIGFSDAEVLKELLD